MEHDKKFWRSANEAICQILMQAACERIEGLEKETYKWTELILECALEDADDIVERRIKKDGCISSRLF